jgi:DNA-binding PadR family transcriptional regulator
MNNKLRLTPWLLIEDSGKPTGKKTFRLTEKGKSFAQGLVKIPEEISKNTASADWEASPKCRKISIHDVIVQ